MHWGNGCPLSRMYPSVSHDLDSPSFTKYLRLGIHGRGSIGHTSGNWGSMSRCISEDCHPFYRARVLDRNLGSRGLLAGNNMDHLPR